MDRVCLCVLILGVFCSAIQPGIAGPCNCLVEEVDCSDRNKFQLNPQELCLNVSKIDLSKNIFTSFPDGLQHFERIYFRNNQLTRLPTSVQLNSEIQTLNVAANNISNTSDELRSLVHLTSLNVKENKITSLGFLPDPCNIQYLNAATNLITSLVAVRRCTHLITLDLARNAITEIPSNAFEGMRELGTLDLDFNPLETIASGAFRNLSSLKLLFLRNGHLTQLPDGVFSSTPNLRMLLLSNNQLSTLPQNFFGGLNSIREISFRGNKLQKLPISRDCCSQLELAHFGWNLISTPSEEAVRSYLRGNGSVLDLRENPVQPSVLRWALAAADIQINEHNIPACGELLKGNSRVKLCASVSNVTFINWLRTGNNAASA